MLVFGIWLWSLNQQTIWHEFANNFCNVHSDVKSGLVVSNTDFKVKVLTLFVLENLRQVSEFELSITDFKIKV